MDDHEVQPANAASGVMREPATTRWFGTAAILAVGMIAGFGTDSYLLALEAMVARLRSAAV